MSTKYGAELLARPPFTKLQFRVLGGGFLVGGEVAVLDHLPQHAVAGFFRAVRVALGGGIAVRRADDSGEKRRFAGAQFAHILAKIGLRGFAEPANRKAAAIAQINVVGVKLEDLLLRKALVEFGGHQDFLHLPPPLALGGEEERARHLHVDRAGALRLLAAAHVVKRRAKHADHVQRAMLEEALVLRGQHRVHHHRRQIVVADHAPLFARAVEEIGDHFRLDFGRRRAACRRKVARCAKSPIP